MRSGSRPHCAVKDVNNHWHSTGNATRLKDIQVVKKHAKISKIAKDEPTVWNSALYQALRDAYKDAVLAFLAHGLCPPERNPIR